MENMSGTMPDLIMEPVFDAKAKIKVIGVGGAGGNAVNRMIEDGLADVEFITINTDAAALDKNKASKRFQIGTKLTKGLGAGANPEVGKAAVEENEEELARELEDTDMVFITAGMGGGTGTGASPVVARLAKEKGILTVAVVTKPFLFEGKVRDRNAKQGIAELKKHVDTIIIIQNQKLLSIVEKGTPLLESFKTADRVLNDATKGISKLITEDGLINVDFADVRTVMTGMGDALMGIGESEDPDNRAVIAAEEAINSPLLEDIDISGAKGLLVNFTGGLDLALDEVNEAHERINEAIGDDVETNIIFGAMIDPEMNGKVQVTVVATGFNREATSSVTSINEIKKEPLRNPVQQIMNIGGQQPKVAEPVAQTVTQTVTQTPVSEPEAVAPVVTNDLPVVDVPVEPVTPPVQNTMPQQNYNQGQSVHVKPSQGVNRHSFDMNDIDTPAWVRKEQAKREEQRNDVVSRNLSNETYHASKGTNMGQGDSEIPAFLRQQMQ